MIKRSNPWRVKSSRVASVSLRPYSPAMQGFCAPKDFSRTRDTRRPPQGVRANRALGARRPLPDTRPCRSSDMVPPDRRRPKFVG